MTAVRRNRTFPLVVALAVLLCPGCFRYTPVALDQVPVGTAIRAQLSAEGLQRLQSRLDTTVEGSLLRATELDARLIGRDTERVLLSIPWVRTGDVYKSQTLHQEVDLPRADVLQISLKRLDRKRTGAVVGVLAVAVGVTAYKVLTGESGGTTRPPDDPGPVEAVIASFLLGWRR